MKDFVNTPLPMAQNGPETPNQAQPNGKVVGAAFDALKSNSGAGFGSMGQGPMKLSENMYNWAGPTAGFNNIPTPNPDAFGPGNQMMMQNKIQGR